MLAWGYNFVAIKLLYAKLTPPALALGRYLVMGIAVLALAYAIGSRPRYPSGRARWSLLAHGALSMGVYMVLFLEGVQRTTASTAAIVLATSPIFALLIESILKIQRFRWTTAWGAALAFVGVACLAQPTPAVGSPSPNSSLFGILLVLASAVCWAVCVVWAKRLVSDQSPIDTLVLGFPGGLLVLLPWAALPTVSAPWSQLTGSDWLLFLHVALGAGALGFFAFYTGVKHIGASGAMLYQYLVPACATLFGVLLLQDPLTPLKLVGFAFIVGGVVLAQRRRSSDSSDLRMDQNLAQ